LRYFIQDVTNYTVCRRRLCHIERDGHVRMDATTVQRTDNTDTRDVERPSEVQLRKDIRHFERQIARLASPSSTWEHGALTCYRTLAMQRRAMLDAVRPEESSRL